MLTRRTPVSVAAALLLSACASATPTATTQPPSGADGADTPIAVLEQARDTAEQLGRREAQFESLIP